MSAPGQNGDSGEVEALPFLTQSGLYDPEGCLDCSVNTQIEFLPLQNFSEFSFRQKASEW
jgi:hypothetical protein